ncbi:hypothetical protein [Bacteroides neonati]|uniref:hypothetical protein n=1 Tax=Bacteroides neonati TaxID=1347393 RepID=UPI0005AA52FC|nr:hypothetical protein [Bacteroides neonati]
MSNDLIDIGFMAAKVAALNDERARIAVSGVSLIYNAAQFAKYQNMVVEYSQILSTITFRARIYGYTTTQELNIAKECNDGIQFCQQQMARHGIIGATDVASLLFEAISALTRK